MDFFSQSKKQLKRNIGQQIKNARPFKIMFGDFLDVGNHRISLFILVLLTKAEAKIQEKQDLNEIVKNIQKYSLR